MKLFLFMSLVTVTLRVSIPEHTPKGYGLDTCTGVFVSNDEILTARHCVEDSRGRQWIKLNDGLSYPVVIKKVSSEMDLALLAIPEIVVHPYVDLGKDVVVTQPVYTVNSGEGYEKTYNQGIVCNIVQVIKEEPKMIMHTGAILPGASGSGLFNSEGKLVGINVKGNRVFSLAVTIQDIRKFLNENHIN